MRTFGIIAIFVGASIAYGQSLPPSSRPASSGSVDQAKAQLAEATASLKEAQAKLDERKTLLLADYNKTPQGSRQYTTMKAAEASLESARKTGTTQERLDASSAFGKARIEYTQASDATIAKDKIYADLARHFQDIKFQVDDLQRRLNAPRKWRAKPGAPKPITDWLNAQSTLRAAMADAKKKEIDSLRQQVNRIQQTPVSQDTTYVLGQARYTPNQEELQRRDEEVRQIQSKIREAEKSSADFAKDKSSLIVPELELTVGAFGSLKGIFQVFQREDDSNVMIDIGEKTLWVRGVDASTLTDDQRVKVDATYMIQSTKTYGTVLGSHRTVLLLEPCDYTEWVEEVLAP